ncbi:MAG: hypothetical protein QF570_08885 [Myxococcota bacterium]|jgi:hypothetical protein|nr:hypothetical protein [Myxococcota bacterium]
MNTSIAASTNCAKRSSGILRATQLRRRSRCEDHEALHRQELVLCLDTVTGFLHLGLHVVGHGPVTLPLQPTEGRRYVVAVVEVYDAATRGQIGLQAAEVRGPLVDVVVREARHCEIEPSLAHSWLWLRASLAR